MSIKCMRSTTAFASISMISLPIFMLRAGLRPSLRPQISAAREFVKANLRPSLSPISH